MNLPNYFIADLPPEATISAQLVADACQTLKRNRERQLGAYTTPGIVRVLAELGDNWLQPDYPFRQFALARGPAETGFSVATLAAGLDALFGQWSRENLHALLVQELGHVQRLDEPCATPEEQRAGRQSLVTGPEMLAHITAGNLPSPTLFSIALGLLVRSAQFVKCARGASFLPRLFAHSLYELDPRLASCLEIAEWRGGDESLEDALFAEADCVTATGSDETLASIRRRLPARTRFLGYGHRVSFGYVGKELLVGFSAKKAAARAAADVAAWNQLGCLSPHIIYVESGGSVSPELFAELLAAELAKREETEPRGELHIEIAATIRARRDFYEVRAAGVTDTRLWCSENSTAWTVVFEDDPRFQASCLHRFIYVKAVQNLDEVLQGADAVRGRVSTVALAADETRAKEMAIILARWGVTRVCPLGRMQQPPLLWHHDGRPALADLVTWTDWEMG